MPLLAQSTTVLLSGIHISIVYLEAFLWATPRGRRIFRTTPEFASQSRVLAANQGLYNGFLAAGLAWAALHSDAQFASQLRVFFNGCVAVAGIFGTISTGSKGILYVQAIPGVLGLAFSLLGM